MYKSTRILFLTAVLLCSFSCEPRNAPSPSDATAGNVEADRRPHQSDYDAGERADAERGASDDVHKKNILIFGDSITAGYGLDSEQAYPALLQEKIDELGWAYNVIDGGLSGDTSAGGLRRIEWMLREHVDIFILELGGNDGLRGTPPAATKQNLQAIIDAVKASNPDVEVILAGMQIPPNLGQDYTTQFRDVFPSLAEENDAHFIPFLLENVGGVPTLNQPDGIHPTADGHEIVAENVWTVLEPILISINDTQASL